MDALQRQKSVEVCAREGTIFLSLGQMTLDIFLEQHRIHEEALIDQLRAHTSITSHKKGAYIIQHGQYIKVLKIVLDGRVRVYQANEAREILIYYLDAMETCTLSLSACFEDCKSTVNAVAEEDTVILNVPVRFVKDWHFNFKSWNTFTTNTFRESYNHLIQQYATLAFQPLKERLFDYLVSKAENTVVKKSHQQLARELGTSREVISRLLKTLEKDQRLILGQKQIQILDAFSHP